MSDKDEAVEVQLKYFQIEDIKKMLADNDRTNMPSQVSFMIDQFIALNEFRKKPITEEEFDAQIGIAIYFWERAFDDGALQILDFVKELLNTDYSFDYDDNLPIINTVYDINITKEKFKEELNSFIKILTKSVCKKISNNIINSELYKAINGLPLESDTVISTEKK